MEVVNLFFLEGGKVFKQPKEGSWWAITDVIVGFVRTDLPYNGRSEFRRQGGMRN